MFVSWNNIHVPVFLLLTLKSKWQLGNANLWYLEHYFIYLNFELNLKSKWYHAKDQSRITNSSDQGRIRTLNLLNASPATLPTDLNLVLFSKMYLGPWQTSMMELLVKIVTTLEANYFHKKTPFFTWFCTRLKMILVK